MLIRRERPADHTAIRAVIAEAFKSRAVPQDVPVEVGLVDALRASSEWIPQLSMVAESEEGDGCRVRRLHARLGGRPRRHWGSVPWR